MNGGTVPLMFLDQSIYLSQKISNKKEFCYKLFSSNRQIDEMSRTFPQILTSVHQELRAVVLMLSVLVQMDPITVFVNLDILEMGDIA